jgi:hypothetical protein
MADKKMAPWLQQLPKTVNQLFSNNLVKVDHHIAAENHVERAPHGPLPHQVQTGKVHMATQRFNDLIASDGPYLNAGKVFGYQ